MIVIAPASLEALLELARAAHPNECCGILLGAGLNIESIIPAANVHPTPQRHFEVDPAALIAAHRAARAGGAEIVGYYHSHPAGAAEPSLTDRAMAAHDGNIWAIIAGGEIKFWRDMPDGFEALSLRVQHG